VETGPVWPAEALISRDRWRLKRAGQWRRPVTEWNPHRSAAHEISPGMTHGRQGSALVVADVVVAGTNARLGPPVAALFLTALVDPTGDQQGGEQ